MRTQQLYNAALYNLKLAQAKRALNNVELKLGSKTKKINLKILLMFIKEDNQGGDTLCG